MSSQTMEGSTLLLQEWGSLSWSKSGPSWHKDCFELLKKKKKAADIGETLKTERLPFTKRNLHLFYIRKGTCTCKGPVCLTSRSVMSNSATPWTGGPCPPGSSIHGDSPGKNTEVGLACPPSGDLPNLGIELASLIPPALAGGLFYH